MDKTKMETQTNENKEKLSNEYSKGFGAGNIVATIGIALLNVIFSYCAPNTTATEARIEETNGIKTIVIKRGQNEERSFIQYEDRFYTPNALEQKLAGDAHNKYKDIRIKSGLDKPKGGSR